MDSNIVVIEYCRNCKQHQWNTRHNEARYLTLFNEFKEALEKQGLKVVQAPTFRLGAFEIHMNGVALFSKFKSEMFPDVRSMVDLIMEFRQEFKDVNKRPDVLKKFSEVVVKQQQADRQKTQQSMQNSHIRHNRNGKYNQFFSSRRFSQPFIETFHSRISGGSSLSGRLNNSHVVQRNVSPIRKEVQKQRTEKLQTIEQKHEQNHASEPKHVPKHEPKQEPKHQQDLHNPEKHETVKPTPNPHHDSAESPADNHHPTPTPAEHKEAVEPQANPA